MTMRERAETELRCAEWSSGPTLSGAAVRSRVERLSSLQSQLVLDCLRQEEIRIRTY